MANLGVNYKDADRIQEALPLLEAALQTAKTNPILGEVGLQLLDSYAKAGKTAEAAKLVMKLLAEARKQLPKDSPKRRKVYRLAMDSDCARPDARTDPSRPPRHF